MRALIIPNLKEYDGFLADVSMDAENEANKKGSEMVIEALVEAMMSLEAESVGAMNGLANGHAVETRKQVAEKIGELLAGRVMELGKPKVVKALLEC